MRPSTCEICHASLIPTFQTRHPSDDDERLHLYGVSVQSSAVSLAAAKARSPEPSPKSRLRFLGNLRPRCVVLRPKFCVTLSFVVCCLLFDVKLTSSSRLLLHPPLRGTRWALRRRAASSRSASHRRGEDSQSGRRAHCWRCCAPPRARHAEAVRPADGAAAEL